MQPIQKIKRSTKLAILIPSVRWNEHTRALIASTIGIANDEIAILIGDNSESIEKKDFLKKIHTINSNIISVSHSSNIGAAENLFFLLDWCKDIEYVAMTGDDDWMTPCYYPNALETLKQNPQVSCCEAGTALADFGSGKHVVISQPSMTGEGMLQRLEKWSAVNARVTMYNVSKRSAIQAAVDFLKMTPLHGLTMAENLWELNRLAVGDFLSIPASSYFIHYPAHASHQGDATQRFYKLLCKDAGLALPALNFMDLCSAIQCALFLMGKLSPLQNAAERYICGQKVFGHIYTKNFMPKFFDVAKKNEILKSITDPKLKNRLQEHISPSYSKNPVLTEEILSLFIDLMEMYQVKKSASPLAPKLRDFFAELTPYGLGQAGSENLQSSAAWSRLSTESSPINTAESITDYPEWQSNRTKITAKTEVIEQPVNQENPFNFHLCIHLSSGEESALADTLDSLSGQPYSNWHLDIVSELPAPEGLDDIPCIGWHTSGTTDNPAVIVKKLIAQRKSDWIVDIPAGVKLDTLYLWRIATSASEYPNTQAFFVDDDCYDADGDRTAPRFKPGCNPAALLSSDLAGVLCVQRQAWLALDDGGAPAGNSFARLLGISEKFGWNSIRHIPDILLSYPETLRSNSTDCKSLLREHFQQQGIDTEILQTGKHSWCIRRPLVDEPRVTIAIISEGNFELLKRCLKSLRALTQYSNFEILVSLKSDDAIPDILNLLREQEKKFGVAIQPSINPSDSTYANRCNSAVDRIKTEFIVFLREEAQVIQETWLGELVRTATENDVAAVMPRLINPGSAQIENIGCVLGMNGMRGLPYQGNATIKEQGYLDYIQMPRDISLLPNACYLIKKQSYTKAGGMDETNFPDHWAEADLSMKLRKNGERLICQPLSNVVFQLTAEYDLPKSTEEIARSALSKKNQEDAFIQHWWPNAAVDPFWNPNLSLRKNTPTPETRYLADWQILPRKLPRILARPIMNGEGYYRIASPLSALQNKGLVQEGIWNQRNGEHSFTTTEIIRLAPDTLIVQNYMTDERIRSLAQLRAVPNRPFMVFAIDDLLDGLADSNPMKISIPPNPKARLKFALAHCDRLVVSTDYLAETYRHLISDIKVIPNRLEQSVWLPLRSNKRTASKPRIGWAGGTTHQDDLLLLREVIEQTRDEAEWVFMGMCPDEIRPLISEFHEPVSMAEYPTYLASLNLDIAVAPLADIPFNHAESNLRLLEYGILGIPVVCTDIEPYRHSPACCVANTTKSWVTALRERIHDPEAREQEGIMMRRWVQQDYLLENYLDEWLHSHLPC